MAPDNDMILTDREVQAYKTILAISRDSDVKKVLTKRLTKHLLQVMFRDVYRQCRKKNMRFMKEQKDVS